VTTRSQIRKLLLPLLIFVATLFSSQTALAEKDFFLYGAAGTAWQLPGSFRAGIGDWELGLLTENAIGFDKLFRNDSGTYAAFGPVIVPGVSFGFYGAFGVEYKLFWGLTLRGEAAGAGGINGFVKGYLTAGLGLHF
jgi:hypothetical protein